MPPWYSPFWGPFNLPRGWFSWRRRGKRSADLAPKVARPLGPFCACFHRFFVQKETSDGGESRPTSWTRHFLPRRVRLAYVRERAVEQGRSGRSCPLLLLCARHSVWICRELVWKCRELVGVGCPFVVLVNTVMSVILAIAITAIAAITAIIKPIKQPSFSPDSFSIGLPAAYHSSRRLVKGGAAKTGERMGPAPRTPAWERRSEGAGAALWMACRTAGRQNPRTPRCRRAAAGRQNHLPQLSLCPLVPNRLL